MLTPPCNFSIFSLHLDFSGSNFENFNFYKLRSGICRRVLKVYEVGPGNRAISFGTSIVFLSVPQRKGVYSASYEEFHFIFYIIFILRIVKTLSRRLFRTQMPIGTSNIRYFVRSRSNFNRCLCDYFWKPYCPVVRHYLISNKIIIIPDREDKMNNFKHVWKTRTRTMVKIENELQSIVPLCIDKKNSYNNENAVHEFYQGPIAFANESSRCKKNYLFAIIVTGWVFAPEGRRFHFFNLLFYNVRLA